MLRKIIVLSVCGLAIGNASADCVLARGINESRTLTLPPTIINVSADIDASESLPIASIKTPAIGYAIGYDDCLNYMKYGKAVSYLTNVNANKIYQTNIKNIGVKLLFSNGSKSGAFPSDQIFTFPGGESRGTYDHNINSYYEAQFFKMDKLDLINQEGEVVLNAGDLAYNWIMVNSPSSYSLKLYTNQIKIISTPVCKTELTKTVDFGTVNYHLLSAGNIEKPLDFSMTCKTDYGSYSASASIISRMASTNGQYIDVTDAGSNIGQMGIEIFNSQGGRMALDGTTIEKPLPVASGVPLNFNWKAKLINIGSKFRPMNGEFSAQAEILLQVN